MRASVKCVISFLLTVVLGASVVGFAQEAPKVPGPSAEQQKRLELMKSKGPEGSLTILPVILAGRPFDRVTEVVGLMLEQQGLKNIELGGTPFSPDSNTAIDALVRSVGEFVGKNPITTEYALYAEFNGNRQIGLVELRAVVVDKTGAVVWTDRQGAEDEAIKQLESKEPMTFSMLLAQRLGPALGLNEATARAAKPGKMARIMSERSGLPPESERAAMPARQTQFKESRQKATLAVYAVRMSGAVDAASATELATMINSESLCKAVAAAQSPLLQASQAGPNEMKVLWDLAREFRDYSRKNPPSTEYALYADYAFNPQNWEQGFVHFVVCDRSGEWVIVDMQNSHQPDYRTVKPTSKADCNKLLLKRLQGYLE